MINSHEPCNQVETYPWLVEWAQWQDAYFRKGLTIPGYHEDAANAKLSKILLCVESARKTPEVWDRVVVQSKRPYVDPGLVGHDDPDVAVLYETSGLVLRFAAWCRMKNEPDAHHYAYKGVYDALILLAHQPDESVLSESVLAILANDHVDRDVVST